MEILSDLVSFFRELFTAGPSGFISVLTSILPLSPFQPYISYFSSLPYIGWINWFVPVQGYLIVWGAWIGAVGLYYIYSAILRWIRVIE